MSPTYLDLHPVYGAIYKEGEFVQRGAVLGLSVDSKGVVIAPVSGWVKMGQPIGVPEKEVQSLRIEIWQHPRISD
ncbi:MAG: hypothetical protein JWL77_6726 [Chthonomonadaceae bacterium]|nr:hypothetical protein [Chthonomonadaceae bacterium]